MTTHGQRHVPAAAAGQRAQDFSTNLLRRLRTKRSLRRAIAPIERRLGVITHVETREPWVALTFDDGPHPQWTPRLLDLLARRGARATFFMVGEMVERYPKLVARVAAEGHAIGNHSWNHPSFPAISHAERASQIARCETALGVHSHKLFRPPFGDLDWPSRLQLMSGGFEVIGWNVSSSDWLPGDAARVLGSIQRRLTPGSIVLLHDQLFVHAPDDVCSRDGMHAALDELLNDDQLRFVTVPQLLAAGRVRARFWTKQTEVARLRTMESFSGLGFRY